MSMMEEKNTLINAVNCKFPHQNLTEIYYNIGRALPFVAQRFPDGRFSDWYHNQYVEVVRVEPGGRNGKFGKVFGFYYRNGKRADSDENNPESSWCTKDETEPQLIPCCGCGSWVLMDIIGEQTTDAVKILALDDEIGFGKYIGMTLRDVISKDWQYVKWAMFNSQHLYTDADKVLEYQKNHRPTLTPDDIISIGKYKGKTIGDIYEMDSRYLIWLSQNNDSFNINWDLLKSMYANMKKKIILIVEYIYEKGIIGSKPIIGYFKCVCTK